MPKNKNAVIRYQVLDKCFANTGRRYYIDDLVDECNKVLSDHGGPDLSVKKRTVQDDIAYMESEAGMSIPLERLKEGRKVYFRYSDLSFSIRKHILTQDEKNNLGAALGILSKLDGIDQFNWLPALVTRLKSEVVIEESEAKIIEYEQNPYLKGMEHFEPVFDALSNSIALDIRYQSYKSQEPQSLTVHPYYLKQYNSRWFLFCKTDGYDGISNYPLDRILTTQQSRTTFIPNITIDFADYFFDVVGVTVKEGPIEQIVLNVDNKLYPYLKTKPLHGSQRVLTTDEKTTQIQLSVIPNYELEQLILSKGEGIEVIAPKAFRKRIKDRVSSMNLKYE